ncbi:MAG: 16S rRNA (cytidine(1402)-2'-O)-methyltransferase, partial [Thiotrichales bacterium]
MQDDTQEDSQIIKTGTLYVVPTPIGNLKDITRRAIEVLGSVDEIIAEDTRHSKILLQYYNIKKPLISLHVCNERQKTTSLMNRL